MVILVRRILGIAAFAVAAVLGAVPTVAQAAPPHIMLIVMENHGAGSIIGNGAAPFENSLARDYITLTNWTGVDHPSAPNYVALTTGQDNHSAGRNDCTPSYPKVTRCDYDGANLGAQFAAAGIPARWYAEDLKGNGCSIKNAQSGRGDVNHEPWAYLPTWHADKTACREAGLTTASPHDARILRALKSANPPDFVWLTPNLQDDTHNGTITHGDRYLKALITAVRKTPWYAHGGTIVVTYDEDEGEPNPRGYCTHPVVIKAVGRHCIPTFIVSRADKGVGKVATAGDHYGMLRSIEQAYGLPLLKRAAQRKYGDITRYLRGSKARLAALPKTAASRASSTRFVAGFSIDTPARTATAAGDGITADILYGGPPRPSSALGRALSKHGMEVVDGRLSGELFYWECHRTHTVAPPPRHQPNDYCATDEEPSVNSKAVVLKRIARWVREDRSNPLVRAYWVLDDWPYWDGGSARSLLRQIRSEIRRTTPRYPAICGFGGAILKPHQRGGFDLSTAKNYSNRGCDMVAWYNYSPFGRMRPSKGAGLDWSMKTLLATEGRDLSRFGWRLSRTPLLGIGQAWSGPYAKRYYQPGLSTRQMRTEAKAFCSYGARAIGWYAWDDSGFGPRTHTPNNSAVIRHGIRDGEAACGFR